MQNFILLVTFSYSVLLEIQNVCVLCFFFKKYFFEISIKGRKQFSKIMLKNIFKVKFTMYRFIKIKTKKYSTVFVGGRFSVFKLFLTASKPEVDKK